MLDRLSLQLEEVHSLVLIGPSGGGKTTLLRILAGLATPDAGEVELDGEAVPVEEAALQRYRRTVGVVFQAFNLFPHLTALENITLPLEKVHGYVRAQAREVALQLLARFQLSAHAGQKPAALSGGQRQRIMIARAVARRPRILLFDEATSSLDNRSQAVVSDALGELNVTRIVIAHRLSTVRKADRIIVLINGRIVQTGAFSELSSVPGAFASFAQRQLL